MVTPNLRTKKGGHVEGVAVTGEFTQKEMMLAARLAKSRGDEAGLVRSLHRAGLPISPTDKSSRKTGLPPESKTVPRQDPGTKDLFRCRGEPTRNRKECVPARVNGKTVWIKKDKMQQMEEEEKERRKREEEESKKKAVKEDRELFSGSQLTTLSTPQSPTRRHELRYDLDPVWHGPNYNDGGQAPHVSQPWQMTWLGRSPPKKSEQPLALRDKKEPKPAECRIVPADKVQKKVGEMVAGVDSRKLRLDVSDDGRLDIRFAEPERPAEKSRPTPFKKQALALDNGPADRPRATRVTRAEMRSTRLPEGAVPKRLPLENGYSTPEKADNPLGRDRKPQFRPASRAGASARAEEF